MQARHAGATGRGRHLLRSGLGQGGTAVDDFEAQTSLAQETAFDPAKSGFVALPVGSPGRPLVLFQETFDGRNPDSLSAVVGAAAEVDGTLQLRGAQVVALAKGVQPVFPRERVNTVLRTVREKNVPHTRYGAVNLVNPDGSIMAYGGFPLAGFYEPYDFFTPELFMLSMTYLYAGEREFGLELGRRCQQNIALEQGMTWDGPNVVRGNTGERGFGNDYYQNMIMWAYPAALAGGDISAPLQKGGLVDRVLQAAQAK